MQKWSLGMSFLVVVGFPPSARAQEAFRYPVRVERIQLYSFSTPALNTAAVQNVSGRVFDLDGRPLAGVDVVALGLGRATTTDGRGGFRFSRLPAGFFEFQFRRQGFELSQWSVTVEPNLPTLDVSIAAIGPTWCAVPSNRKDIACPMMVVGARAAEQPDRR
jgi:hypothetical protein